MIRRIRGAYEAISVPRYVLCPKCEQLMLDWDSSKPNILECSNIKCPFHTKKFAVECQKVYVREVEG